MTMFKIVKMQLVAALLVAGAVLGIVAQQSALAQSGASGSYVTVKWESPKIPATGDLAFCVRTGAALAQPLRSYSNSKDTVLRFFVARPAGRTTPVDYTVSFEGKVLASGSGATAFDNVYVTQPLRPNSTYRFVLHVDRATALSYATVDSNTHEIEIVACGAARCPHGHEWSDARYKYCPYDGKELSQPK